MEDITIQQLWQLLQPSKIFDSRGRFERCCRDWSAMDAGKRARVFKIIETKRHNGEYVHPNPCFALNDALQEDEIRQAKIVRPEPTNYNGRAFPNEPTAIALYKGKWGTFTLADIKAFGLKTRD